MLARDIMTKEVITVKPDTTVEEVIKILAENKISGVPVVNDHGGVIGIVSEADLLVRDAKLRVPSFINVLGSLIFLEDPRQLDEDLRKMVAVKVRELMTEDVITVEEDTPVEEVASLMLKKKINRVPVVSHGKLVGIISRHDIVRALAAKKEKVDDF
ncbi:MAG: hypothetical protein PWQ91_24 [Eubacteriales bacterium]|nr:hypothetical protein [Eubacteriales bacterium]MDN5362963.1 hypothetical protein [Eubacteriales bacterium]